MNVWKIFWGMVLAIMIYEFIEHVIFPLVWSWKVRRRPSLTGVESFFGKHAHVVRWHKTRGVVLIDGERWQAESSVSFAPGDLVRVTGAHSLILTVTSAHDGQEKLSRL